MTCRRFHCTTPSDCQAGDGALRRTVYQLAAVLDAILDPIHTSFLHSRMSRIQFSEGFGSRSADFFDRGQWLLGTNTRRVGDNLWFRVNELVLPNFTQAGAAFATDGTQRRLYGRSAFNRWVLPIDDEHSVALGWASWAAWIRWSTTH